MPTELPENQVVESAEAREDRERNERAEGRRAKFLEDAIKKYESLNADAVAALTNAVSGAKRLKSCAWDEYDGEDIVIHNVAVVGDDVVVEFEMKEFGFIEKRKIRIADFV